MLINEPQDLETYLLPMLGEISVTPKNFSRFWTDIESFYGFSSRLFSFKSSPAQIVVPPLQNKYTFVIPITSEIYVQAGKFNTIIPTKSMFLCTPYERLTLKSAKPWHSIVFTINTEELAKDHDFVFLIEQLRCNIVCTCCHLNNVLYRTILQAWSKANEHALPARIAANREIEIELMSAFIEWLDGYNSKTPTSSLPKYYFKYAKEYLDSMLKQEVSKDALEAVTGVSIRSITREFKKHTGMGPMAYLKQRRLDAAYLDLLNANPQEKRVSDIALEYGLNHFGKFATEYKKVFQESPSRTLSLRR